MNNVRPTQRPAGQQNGKPQSYMQPASAQKNASAQAGMQQVSFEGSCENTTAREENFLQKFMGGITGQNKKAAEAAVVPPVPPGYVESHHQLLLRADPTLLRLQNSRELKGSQQPRRIVHQGVKTIQSGKPGAPQNGCRVISQLQSRPMPATNARPTVGSQSQVKNSSPQNNAPAKSVPDRTAQATSTNDKFAQPVNRRSLSPQFLSQRVRSPRNPRASAPPEPVANAQQFVQPCTAPAFNAIREEESE